MNSLQKLIAENQNWKELLENKDIKIKEDEHFYIFNYGICADFSDSVVRDCRGIILDKSDFSIACYPFTKFCNYSESYHDDIDWNTARVQSKIDGSIVKLFYNKYDNDWQWATNGVIDARLSDCNSIKYKTYYKMIIAADNYGDINFDALDKNKTYIFELVGPDNQIVVLYDKIHLYHIGTRNNLTGQESNDDIGIEKPIEYSLHTLEDCIKAAEALNKNKNRVDYEGFVVVDADWHRIKIKSPAYLMLHHLANNGLLLKSKSKLLEVLTSDDFDRETILEQYPEYEEIFDYYENEIVRVEQEVQKFMDDARELYEKLGKSQKELANVIKNNKYSDFGFKAVKNNNITAKELIAKMPKSKYEALIKDFE